MQASVQQNQPEVGGYTLGPMLGEGATSRVYRASKGGRDYALKLMREDVSGDKTAHALRFRKEAETLRRMNHPSLVRVFELGEHGGLPFVVMELIDGTELSQVLKERALDEGEIVRLAAGAAGALSEVHRQGIIHRDIKPDNIFITKTGAPKLIDFGFAEGQSELKAVSNEAAGTFLYASPEQSGVLKEAVDAASDLYSLGAVLFECAARRPPFQSEDISELLNKHLSEKAPSTRAHNPGIGHAMDAIIARLLEKKPKDRYQTAEGLLADVTDLAGLEAEFKNSGKISLGQRDYRIGRQNEMPLLGRTTEMRLLQSEVERHGDASGVGFIIEGEPGSGKSFLIKKFIESFDASTTLVLSGKSQLAEQTPLGPLREAIDNYIREITLADDETKTKALDVLKDAAKGVEVFVRRLSKALADRLGGADTPGDEQFTQEKFFAGVAQFFTTLAKRRGRILLHIDDVQWLDQASLGILTQVQDQLKECPVILLTTARNDSASQEALTKVAAMWSQSGNIKKLSLKPLSLEAIGEIVKVQLGGQALNQSVIDRLAAKANGNPFAVCQYVYAMADARILRKSGGQWEVDETRLDEMIVSADVVDLILSRMKSLSAQARDVLRMAAVIGTKFEENLLRNILGEDVGPALGEAVRANLLENSSPGRYAFVHDRILEALLKDLSEEQIKEHHQRIAETMDNGTAGIDLYALASHYAQGVREKTPDKAYKATFDAGILSLENFANEDAVEYLEVAEKIAYGPLAATPPGNMLALHESLGMGYWRKGMGKKAIEHCEQVLRLSKEPLVQAQVRAMMTNIYFNENQGSKGWIESELGLKVLGTSFPKAHWLAVVMNWVHWARYHFVRRFKIGFGAAQDEELSKIRVLMRLFGPSTFASFVGLRYEVTAQLVPRMLYQLHRLGDRIEAVPGLAFYALWLGFHNAREACLKMAHHAVEIAQWNGDNLMIAHARFYAGFGIHWAGLPKEAEKFQKESLLAFGKWMAPRWYISTANDLAGNNLLIRGHARDALTIADLCQKKAAATKNTSPIAVSKALALGVHAVLGQEAAVEKGLQELEQIYAGIPEGALDWTWYMAHRILVSLERDEPVVDLDTWIERYLKIGVSPRRAPLFFKTMYFYSTYAALQMYQRATAETRADASRRLEQCLARMIEASGTMPHWLCHVAAIRAEKALTDGHLGKAKEFFNQAERLAGEADSPWGLFLVERGRARIAKRENRGEDTLKHAVSAEAIASENSWGSREAAIRKEFQTEFAQRKVRASGASDGGVSSEALQRQFDTLLSISRVAAQHTGNIKDLADSTLKELNRIFAADRAFLIIQKGDGSFDQHGRDSGGKELPSLTGYSSTVLDKVIKDRQSLIVSGTAEGALIGSKSIVAQDLRSIIAAPLVYRQKNLGAIYLDSRMTNGLFDQDDMKLLEGVGNQLAVFIEAAHNASKLQALLEVSLASGAVLDPEAQTRIALDEVIQIFGAQRAFLFFTDEVTGELRMGIGRDSQKKDLTEIKGYSTTIVNRSHTEGKPVLVTGSDEGDLLGSKSAVVHDLRSIMAAPLIHKGQAMGVLYLDSQVAKGGFTPDDVRVLTGISNLISVAFVTSRIAKLEIDRRNLEKNLEVTGTVQMLLLPNSNTYKINDLQLIGHFQPAEQSGGDWWWYEKLANGNLMIAVGDVTGHGAGPAMVTAVVAGIFRTINTQLSAIQDLSNLGVLLNQKLVDICQGQYWMTMAIIEVNPYSGHVKLWSAGAPPLMLHNREQKVDVIFASGSQLGTEPKDFSMGFSELTLQPNETLFISTDGVVEMETPGGQLGMRKMMKMLVAAGERPTLNESYGHILAYLQEIRGPATLADDVTFVLLKRDQK